MTVAEESSISTVMADPQGIFPKHTTVRVIAMTASRRLCLPTDSYDWHLLATVDSFMG